MVRLISKMFFSALFLLCIWSAGILWFSTQIPLKFVDSPQQTDAIVVLTGGSGRIAHGLELLKDGKAEKLFISGVESKVTAMALTARYDRELVAILEDSGQQNRIELGYTARNTIGNTVETLRWIEREQPKSIRLVTANYHMPRAMQEFRYSLPKSITIHADPVFPEDFKMESWWADATSRKLVLSEYHKYLAARLRHWLIDTVEKD